MKFRRKIMSEKNIEMMKKIIEEKKNKGGTNGGSLRPDSTIGHHRKASRSNKKQGGVTDK
jgi:hypothetical protein